jgi:hypothetical protein
MALSLFDDSQKSFFAEQAIASRKNLELTQLPNPKSYLKPSCGHQKSSPAQGSPVFRELHQSHNRTDGEGS